MMKRLRIIVIASIVALSGQAVAQSTYVPLDHQVYPLLVKGETLGLFESYRMRTLPLTRTEVLEMLTSMDRAREKLSRADADLLEQMLGEFTDPAIGEPAPPGSEPHAFRYEEGSTQIFVDTRVTQEFHAHRDRVHLEDETISKTSASVHLRARFGDHVFLGASARSALSVGEKRLESHFDPSQGQPQVVVGRTVFTDQTTGYVGLRYGSFNLFAGRMYLGWGSGVYEQLAVSASNEPMEMVRFVADFEAFRFSYFHANLKGISQGRYFVGHRLDILLPRGLQVGIYETVVYGGRGVQFEYLNPFVFYNILEKQLGDLDNKTAGVDLTLMVTPGLRAYAEVFIDDLNVSKSISRFWGNKLAYHIGMQWSQPLKWREGELFATYTRIDPYVYTHYNPLNVYVHYNESLGSKLGPNSDRYYFGIVYQPQRDIRTELSFSSRRHGAGTIYGPVRPADEYSKEFLAGVVETEKTIDLRFRYQLHRNIFVGFQVRHSSRENVDNLPHLRAAEKFFRVFLDIDYY